jgi:hypothetical protein
VEVSIIAGRVILDTDINFAIIRLANMNPELIPFILVFVGPLLGMSMLYSAMWFINKYGGRF